MTTDFRALCAELLSVLDDHDPIGVVRREDVIDRAVAALAQPEPQGPSDEDIYQLALDGGFLIDIGDGFSFAVQDESGFARAVLARWGRTALSQPEPEFTAEEVEMIQAPWCYLAPAQPEPVGPTDDQAEDLADALNFMDGYAEHEDGFYVCASNLGPFARAVLARWGRPTITPSR